MKSLRQIAVLTIFLSLAFISVQCSKGTKSQASGLDLLSMLPENASGYVTFNFKKIAELGLFKTMQESMKSEDGEKAAEALNTFSQFISQTGFDPEKDLHGGAAALFGDLGDNSPKFIFIAEGNFNPEKMISYAKSQNPGIEEETIGGITIYQMEKTEGEEAPVLCFPKVGLAAMGQIEQMKATIAVIQGKGRSIIDNPALSQHAKNMNADALSTVALIFPEKARSMQEQMPPPFEFDLSKAEAVTADLYFESDVWSGTINLVSPNPEGNKKNANTLNMLKNMGVMLGPEVGEVLNSLSINASDKHLEIRFSITKDQLEKLGKKAKETLPGMSSEAPTEAITE